MPNWCNNQVTIHGTKEQILELVGAYERGGVIEHYLPTPREPDDPTKLLGEDKPFNPDEDTTKSWYYWRIANWGTKWDFGKTEYTADEQCLWSVGTEPEDEGYGSVNLLFDTAWSPPIGWYEALNALDMIVEAYYFEPGVGFCGQWSNPVEGIVDEEITIDNPKMIPYTISQIFNTEEFYSDTGELIDE